MNHESAICLALIVRSGAYHGRSARDQLDIALAAASLDWTLELFFIGDGVTQLLANSEPGQANLPRGQKGWGGLPHMTPIRCWIEAGSRAQLADAGGLLLEAEELSARDMLARVQACDHAWVV